MDAKNGIAQDISIHADSPQKKNQQATAICVRPVPGYFTTANIGRPKYRATTELSVNRIKSSLCLPMRLMCEMSNMLGLLLLGIKYSMHDLVYDVN